ncbi:hypothetical protein KAU93_03375 [Candidatus Bathyarchaeota archaeon]|nr:hypothetical protein [Candidatus Bathyarchaeota archaeon]
MSKNNEALEKLQHEFRRFQKEMEELRYLKCVAEDLRSLRKMITLKRYD